MSPNSYISISERASWPHVSLTLGVAASIVLFCALLNWFIDPFDRLGRNRLGVYASSERDVKSQMVQRYAHDALAIGSSRVGFIDTTKVRGYRMFNAAFSQAVPEEMLGFLRLFARDQKLIVIGLDFMMFNESEYPIRQDPFAHLSPDSGDRPITIWDIKRLRDYLVSLNVVGHSIRTVAANLGTSREEPQVLPWGARNSIPPLAHMDGPVIDYNETLRYWRSHVYHQFRFAEARLGMLREIKLLLDHRGIPAIVFINPENEALMGLVRDMGLAAVNIRFRAEVRAIFPNAVDLTESRWSGAEHYFRKDPSHYRPHVGAAIVNELIDLRRARP